MRKVWIIAVSLVLAVTLLGMMGCAAPPIGESSEPPFTGFELVQVYVPDKWPDWAPQLVRGKYSNGRIIADKQEFTVVIEEWIGKEGRVLRLSIKNIAVIERFVNFDIPASGPPGIPPEAKRAKGQTVILNTELYHFLFTE